ncbi:unnamed protein product [Ectocarpus sp. 6 AP-2014]
MSTVVRQRSCVGCSQVGGYCHLRWKCLPLVYLVMPSINLAQVTRCFLLLFCRSSPETSACIPLHRISFLVTSFLRFMACIVLPLGHKCTRTW